MTAPHADLTRRFYAAYRDRTLAVLEGFHPARHALRFGGRIQLAVTYDRARLARAADRLDPEVMTHLDPVLATVDRERFSRLSRRSLSSPLLSIASRPDTGLGTALTASDRPVVFVERPRNPGNVGAVIRVAAAADVGGVIVSGTVDPWSPVVLRSATGLQYAVPVCSGELPADVGRPIVALDPGGEPLGRVALPPDAVMAVGGERYGLSAELRDRATHTVGVPMKPGVSSLNLATAVAAVLFAWRCGAGRTDAGDLW